MRIIVPTLLCAAGLFGQDVRFGVVAGVPATQYFDTGAAGGLHGDAHYSAATRRYTFGAAVEWRRPQFSIEVAALYHRMGYVAYVGDAALDVKGNSIDFPVLVTHRFGRLWVGGGGVLRRVGPVRGRGETTTGIPLDTTQPEELRKRLYPGVTAAAGVELGRGRLRLIPECRYTRWTANITPPGGLVRFASNQVEFLAGLWF